MERKVNGVDTEEQLVSENTAKMPGLLKRSHDLVDAENDATGLQDGEQRPSKRQATEMTNGDHAVDGYSHFRNAGNDDGALAPTDMIPAIEDFEKQAGPPDLEHIGVQSFIPLNIVTARIAQEAHNAIEELITELANPEMQPSYEKDENGNDIPTRELYDVNITKKNKLWEFGQLWRSKFIKLMVLSQWSRNAEALSKIIDINHFIETQKIEYREAVRWMGELKRILVQDKQPAPDLKSALEVLSTGKAAWKPSVSCPYPCEDCPS